MIAFPNSNDLLVLLTDQNVPKSLVSALLFNHALVYTKSVDKPCFYVRPDSMDTFPLDVCENQSRDFSWQTVNLTVNDLNRVEFVCPDTKLEFCQFLVGKFSDGNMEFCTIVESFDKFCAHNYFAVVAFFENCMKILADKTTLKNNKYCKLIIQVYTEQEKLNEMTNKFNLFTKNVWHLKFCESGASNEQKYRLIGSHGQDFVCELSENCLLVNQRLL